MVNNPHQLLGVSENAILKGLLFICPLVLAHP